MSALAVCKNWKPTCTVHCSLLFTALAFKGSTSLKQTRKKKSSGKALHRVNVISPINHIHATHGQSMLIPSMRALTFLRNKAA